VNFKFKGFETLRTTLRLGSNDAELKLPFYALLIPVFFALLTGFFEVLSLGLLVPTLKGILEAEFEFIRGLPVLGGLIPHIDTSFPYPNAIILITLIGLIVVSAALKSICQFASNTNSVFIVTRFSRSLRQAIFRRYLSFGKLYFDHQNVGAAQDLLSKFPMLISNEIRSLSRGGVTICLLFANLFLMMMISPWLTLSALILFPIIHFGTTALVRKIESSTGRLSQANLKLAAQVGNALSCIPLVKMYCTEQEEDLRFSEQNQALEHIHFKTARQRLLIEPFHEVVAILFMVLLVAIVGLMVVRQGSGVLPAYLVFLLTFKRSAYHFGAFNNIRSTFANLRGISGDLLKLFDDRGKHFLADGTRQMSRFNHEMMLEHVNFAYPSRKDVIRDVSLRIKRGEHIALVGPSGSGKTTLIQLILRLYDVSSGRILIDGVDLKSLTLKSLRKHMAVVSQDIYLFNASLKYNLSYGLDGTVSDEQLLAAMHQAKLETLLSKVPEGLNTLIGDRGIQLSGGEKQRVSIARAILRRCEILILDEATSSLDSETEKDIQEAIRTAMSGKTAIIVAHRLSTIQHVDRIVVIEDGKKIEEGTLSELIEKKGSFQRHWELQRVFSST
jgi:ATP-binding cassette, subfamily B, bacterial MsbA